MITGVSQFIRASENILSPPVNEYEAARWWYEYFKIEKQLGSALAESGYHPHQYAYLLDTTPDFKSGKDWYINTFIPSQQEGQYIEPLSNPHKFIKADY